VKQYQVTRKLQVTIPHVLAKELRIRPGDTVVFQKAGNAVLMKKSKAEVHDRAELVQVIEGFAADMANVGKYVRTARRAIAASLSRHIGT
jgi:bifunctional DNA-binding transcriptional regulator/antitoxin component of YhaV-PrlF toxin-antitoxin module